ncbi:hypothetical protein HAX54_027876, partial [Datura stramonium]|nr:hypothetical protein [Datura stramonium]
MSNLFPKDFSEQIEEIQTFQITVPKIERNDTARRGSDESLLELTGSPYDLGEEGSLENFQHLRSLLPPGT